MKTKNIFKALAFAILMPALLLNTACNSEIINNENTDGKGFALPVTVNVTRQGDDATKATYNESTGKLSFSEGDKLLVRGNDNSVGGAGSFAGMLDYDTEKGNFSGTIYTQNEYSGTADELFSAASGEGSIQATLLPAGYESYGFLAISGSGYNTSYSMIYDKAIAATKAAAVEQFSLERTKTYSSGFALSPENAILNFTITGLTDGAKDVTLKNGSKNMFTGSVTPTSGTAAFALGARLDDPVNLKNVTLTIGGTDIAIISTNKYLEAGKIYNISRNVLIVNPVVGQVIGDNGKNYANAAAAVADGATACAIIAYVGSDTGESAPYNHGLAIAMKDANNGNSTMWMWNDSEPHYSAVNPHQYTDIADALAAKESGSSLSSGKNNGTYPAFQAALANSITTETGISAAAPATGTSGWFMPSIFQWNQIVNGLTGTTTPFTTSQNVNLNYSAVNTKITAAGGVGLRSHYYWSSTEYDSYKAWMYVADLGKVEPDSKSVYVYVRAAFAF